MFRCAASNSATIAPAATSGTPTATASGSHTKSTSGWFRNGGFSRSPPGNTLTGSSGYAFTGQTNTMALRIEQLKKSYLAPDGTVSPVINIDSLGLADGEQVALMGSSGSGKTTLLHLIAGILKPDSGKI